MVQRALALHDDPVAELLALAHQPLDGALGEVADQAVDRDAPALDHHPGLAGRHERDRVAARLGGSPELEGDRHLADRAVAADGQDHPLARCVPPAHGRLHPLGRAPVVHDRAAGRGRGGRELGVVADEGVQAGEDVEAGRDRVEDDRSPRLREPAARRRDPDQQRVRRRLDGQRVGERRDDRDVVARQVRVDVLAGPRRIDDRGDVVTPVADDAVGRLRVVGSELALGEDGEAAEGGWSHRPSLRKSRVPRGTLASDQGVPTRGHVAIPVPPRRRRQDERHGVAVAPASRQQQPNGVTGGARDADARGRSPRAAPRRRWRPRAPERDRPDRGPRSGRSPRPPGRTRSRRPGHR